MSRRVYPPIERRSGPERLQLVVPCAPRHVSTTTCLSTRAEPDHLQVFGSQRSTRSTTTGTSDPETYQYLDAEGMPVQDAGGPRPTPLRRSRKLLHAGLEQRINPRARPGRSTAKIAFSRPSTQVLTLTRSVDANMDYTNYTRTAGGSTYSCTCGAGRVMPPTARRPATRRSWVGTTISRARHQSHEFALSTRTTGGCAPLGAYWENFQIRHMNFLQKTIPSCTPEKSCRGALPGGCAMPCERDAGPGGDRSDDPQRQHNFGEDLQRGYKADRGVRVGRLRHHPQGC